MEWELLRLIANSGILLRRLYSINSLCVSRLKCDEHSSSSLSMTYHHNETLKNSFGFSGK